MWLLVFLLQTGLLSHVAPFGLPTYIHPCSRNDPNLNACATKTAQESIMTFSKGDPTRGLEPLDPLYVPEMVVYVPNESGLKIRFLDNHFKGLSKMELESLKFDLNKHYITVDALVTLDVDSKYDLSGKILMMAIKSDGDATIKLKNTDLHVRLWYDHVEGADGKIHWKIKKHDIKYEVEKATFKLDNLLGDKNIGDQINKLMNELWREIIADVGPAIRDSLGTAVVDNLAVLLEQVTYDELMPE